MIFRHPSNGYRVEPKHAFLWCLLFGVFYFLKHSVWGHALISLGAAFITVGISWVVYPFFAKRIIRHAYLSRGWVEEAQVAAT
jgi:hypothetical protein